MRNKISLAVGLILTLLLSFTACEQYNWDPPKWDYAANEPGNPRPVVYDDHIAPLFPKYDCTGCHGGVIPPDLRPANSYTSLTTGGYINGDDPEESRVVMKIEDAEHGGTWNTDDLFLLLDWIYEETLPGK